MYTIDDSDILNHVSNASFKNSNQILRIFDDPIDGACTYNDSRYISDHLPYFANIKLKMKTKRKKKTVLAFKNTEESINGFQNDVSNAVNNISINDDLLGNPNDSYNAFENIIMEAKCNHS